MTTNILRLSWLLWITTILFAWWFIPPRIDDGIYLFPAISVLNNLPPAGIINNSIQPVFYIFPTQPFLHGIFLKFLSLFSIDVGINTYRVFNYFAVILLFYLVRKLFITIFNISKKSDYATSAILILLGLSQFSVQFFVNRPEVLALVFFTAGLISTIKFITKLRKNSYYIVIAFVSFGISITLHANFIILSGFMVLYLLWLIVVSYKLRYLKFLVAFFIPLLLFLAWFLFNLEVAYDQLFGRINHATQDGLLEFKSATEMLSIIMGDSDKSLTHKMYLGLHMLTLLIELLLLPFLFFIKSKSYCIDSKVINLFKVLSFAIIVLFSLMEPWPANYLLVSFLAIISIVFFVFSFSFGKNTLISGIYILRASQGFRLFIYSSATFFILSLPFFHSLKVYASNGYYFNHHKTIESLSGKLLNNGHMFINSPQLLPLYADIINKNYLYKSDKKRIKIHWYFPVSDSPSMKSQELMLQSIFNDVTFMQGALWGTLKEYFSLKSGSACLTLAAKKHYLKIDGVKVLYEDRDNIFFISDNVKLSTKAACYE